MAEGLPSAQLWIQEGLSVEFQHWSPEVFMNFVRRMLPGPDNEATVNTIQQLNLDGDFLGELVSEPEDAALLPIPQEVYKTLRDQAEIIRKRYIINNAIEGEMRRRRDLEQLMVENQIEEFLEDVANGTMIRREDINQLEPFVPPEPEPEPEVVPDGPPNYEFLVHQALLVQPAHVALRTRGELENRWANRWVREVENMPEELRGQIGPSLESLGQRLARRRREMQRMNWPLGRFLITHIDAPEEVMRPVEVLKNEMQRVIEENHAASMRLLAHIRL